MEGPGCYPEGCLQEGCAGPSGIVTVGDAVKAVRKANSAAAVAHERMRNALEDAPQDSVAGRVASFLEDIVTNTISTDLKKSLRESGDTQYVKDLCAACGISAQDYEIHVEDLCMSIGEQIVDRMIANFHTAQQR